MRTFRKPRAFLAWFACAALMALTVENLHAADHKLDVVKQGNTKSKCQESGRDCPTINALLFQDYFRFGSAVADWCVEFKPLGRTDHSPFTDDHGDLLLNFCGKKGKYDGWHVVAAPDCVTKGSPECTYNYQTHLYTGNADLPSDDPTIIVDPGSGGPPQDAKVLRKAKKP